MSQCSDLPSAAVGGGCAGEIMLFGVRVKVDPMRKIASLNNLSDYEPVNNNGNNDEAPKAAAAAAEEGVADGYATADDAVPQPINGSRERKRGVPWTEEEHKLFLIGLQKVGKGDWRGISRNYVKTRTPTQVASHAQKYFLRRSNLNRRRRRSSLFDITTDSVTPMPVEKGKKHEQSPPQPPSQPLTSNATGFSAMPFPVTAGPVLFSMQSGNSMESSALGQHVLPMPTSSPMVDLNLRQQVPVEPSPLSLRLSLSSGQDQPSMRDSSFQVMPSFKHGDSSISVA